jgi:hypothetical protein
VCTSPQAGFELTTLVVKGTACIGICKSTQGPSLQGLFQRNIVESGIKYHNLPFKIISNNPDKPLFKMVAVTKNRNVFKWPKLLQFFFKMQDDLLKMATIVGFPTILHILKHDPITDFP